MSNKNASDWLTTELARIRLFADCVPVSGYINPSSSVTIASAEQLLRALHAAGLRPKRVVHGADGEITLRFESKEREARIIVDEDDGELLFEVNRKNSRTYHYEELSSVDDAIAALRVCDIP